MKIKSKEFYINNNVEAKNVVYSIIILHKGIYINNK